MEKTEKLVIIGDGEFAQIAYEYFTHDSQFEVVAFSVEKEYIKTDNLYGLPIVPFEDLEKYYSPSEYKVFTAITYTQLNRVRARLASEATKKGYKFATYVSSKAFVWNNVRIGENSFIFENNVLQHNVKIGNNVILWSGNHIGHRSVIHDNCYISSHVVISGFCEIEENCFIGVNTTLADHVKVARDCFIGAGAVIHRDTEEGKIYQGNPAQAAKVGSLRFLKVREDKVPV